MADPRRSPEKSYQVRDGDDYLQSPRSRWMPGMPPLLGRSSSSTYRQRALSGQATTIPEDPTSPPGTQGGPQTPLFGRSYSSAFNSPGQTFRSDDEIFVFEIGSRFLRAGLGGEDKPRCILDFGPDSKRRLGDYSKWLPNQPVKAPTPVYDFAQWGQEYELWKMDIRGLDLAYVSDRLRRNVQTAISDHVLIQDDAKKRLLTLVIPPAMPHPLLQTALDVFFNLFPNPPSISLVSSPTLCAISAGVRSALVVDIGWNETTITPVAEYKEIFHRRNLRAGRLLSWHTSQLLSHHLREQRPELIPAAPSASTDDDSSPPCLVPFEDTQEVLQRLCHARSREPSSRPSEPTEMIIPIPSYKTYLTLPFSTLSEPAEHAFLTQSTHDPLPEPEPTLATQIYKTLLDLPPDLRGGLLHRITFTGGASSVPGLKPRILADLRALIAQRGWDPTDSYGSASGAILNGVGAGPAPHPARRTVATVPLRPRKRSSSSSTDDEPTNRDADPASTTPAHAQPQLPDPVLAAIARTAGGLPARRILVDEPQSQGQDSTEAPQPHAAEPRAVKSLGAWAGASLLSGLRVRAAVEIERERFLATGLLGYHGAGTEEDGGGARGVQEQSRPVDMLARRKSGGRPLAGTRTSTSIVPAKGVGLGVWA